MKYDLIVVGAGPGGLMAARTAARDGLKVLLVERKKVVTEVKRACVQIFYLNKLDANWLTMQLTSKMDAYIEQVSVETFPNRARFNFLDAGFSLDYAGSLRAYYNWFHLSPSGHSVMRYPVNNVPWGYYVHKEALLAELLADVAGAGVEIMTETVVQSAANVDGGVELRVSGKTGEQTLAGRAAVAADGLNSTVVESLGLNRDRPIRNARPRQILFYIVEGVECPFHDTSWMMWDIPSLKADNLYMGLGPNNCNLLGTGSSSPDVSPAATLEGIMRHPTYAPWFAKARVVGKMGTSLVSRPALEQVVEGNVLMVGDAGASVECWMQGAIVSGYKAVKALQRQWDGADGYREYNDWWAGAFAFNQAAHIKRSTDTIRGGKTSIAALISRFNDQDMDAIYQMFEGQIGNAALLAAANLEQVKRERPDLYAKMLIPGKEN
jgi:digeranylgeranylglycerophospholipid reductase